MAITKFKITNSLPKWGSLYIHDGLVPLTPLATVDVGSVSSDVYNSTANFLTQTIPVSFGDYFYNVSQNAVSVITNVDSDTVIIINSPYPNIDDEFIVYQKKSILLNIEYDYSSLATLNYVFDKSVPGVPSRIVLGNPLESFTYKLMNDDGTWSEDIVCTIIKNVNSGSPALTSKTEIYAREATIDITNLFVFNAKTDRVFIEDIIGGIRLNVNGVIASKGSIFMTHDFYNVMLITGPKNRFSSNTHGELIFKVGNKDVYSNNVVYSFTLSDNGFIVEDTTNSVLNIDYNEFVKTIKVDNGPANDNAIIEITPNTTLDSFLAYFSNTVMPLSLNGKSTLSVPLNEEGDVTIVLRGNIHTLTPNTDYAFILNVLLTSFENTINSVDTNNNELNINVVSPPVTVLNLGIINNITLISAIESDPITLDYIEVYPDSLNESLSITAVINKFSGYGTEPFEYSIIENVNNGVTITQSVTSPNEFVITNVNDSNSNFVGGKQFTAKIIDGLNVVSTYVFGIREIENIPGAVPVLTAGSISAYVNSYIDYLIIVASGAPIISYPPVSLPTGLVLTNNGRIQGSVTTIQSPTNYPVTATNSVGTSAPVNISIEIKALVSEITNVLTLNLTENQTDISFMLTGSNNPNLFSAINLPTGLSINTSTGEISGTQLTAVAGTYNVDVKCSNDNGVTYGSVKNLVITISAVVVIPVVNSAGDITATAGSVVSYIITALYNPTSYGVKGLPSGLSLSGNEISGSIWTPGVYTFMVKATNSAGTGTKTVSLTITSNA